MISSSQAQFAHLNVFSPSFAVSQAPLIVPQNSGFPSRLNYLANQKSRFTPVEQQVPTHALVKPTLSLGESSHEINNSAGSLLKNAIRFGEVLDGEFEFDKLLKSYVEQEDVGIDLALRIHDLVNSKPLYEVRTQLVSMVLDGVLEYVTADSLFNAAKASSDKIDLLFEHDPDKLGYKVGQVLKNMLSIGLLNIWDVVEIQSALEQIFIDEFSDASKKIFWDYINEALPSRADSEELNIHGLLRIVIDMEEILEVNRILGSSDNGIELLRIQNVLDNAHGWRSAGFFGGTRKSFFIDDDGVMVVFKQSVATTWGNVSGYYALFGE